MSAGVVPHALKVTVDAGFDVSTELGRPAGHDAVCGFELMPRQASCRRVVGEVLAKKGLDGARHCASVIGWSLIQLPKLVRESSGATPG